MQHFTLEPTHFPGEEQLEPEGLGERAAVGLGHGPVHQRAALTAIDAMVMQLDAFRRHAGLQQVQHACHGILAAGKEHQDLGVVLEPRGLRNLRFLDEYQGKLLLAEPGLRRAHAGVLAFDCRRVAVLPPRYPAIVASPLGVTNRCAKSFPFDP